MCMELRKKETRGKQVLCHYCGVISQADIPNVRHSPEPERKGSLSPSFSLSLSLICSSITLSRQSRNHLKLLGGLLASQTNELISQTHTQMKPDVSLPWTSKQIEMCVCPLKWTSSLTFCSRVGQNSELKIGHTPQDVELEFLSIYLSVRPLTFF